MKVATNRSFVFLLAVAAALATLPCATLAKSSSVLNLSDIRIRSQQRLLYHCAGDVRLRVRYINSNAGAFVYLSVADRKQLFVSVVAASGVKYVGGRYVWWTQGEEGFLADGAQKEGAEPLLKECKQIGKW